MIYIYIYIIYIYIYTVKPGHSTPGYSGIGDSGQI